MSKITETTINNNTISGTKFVYGNIFVGVRGTLDEARQSNLPAINLPLFYDKVGDNWAESVNAPNPFYLNINVDGVNLNGYNNYDTHYQELDLENSIFSRKTTFKVNDYLLTLETQRFVSFDKKTLLCGKYIIKSNKDCTVEITTGIDNVVFDINGPHLKNFKCSRNNSYIESSCLTYEHSKKIIVRDKLFIEEEYEIIENDGIYKKFFVNLKANKPYTYSKLSQIITDYTTKNNQLDSTFDIEYSEHKKAFSSLFNDYRVEIEGSEKASLGIDYTVHQLICLSLAHRKNSSIPARGISGQTYKGAIFWDTEMFLLPFYLNNDLNSAKEIINYRINSLPKAIKKASSYGYKGAFYAWESINSGEDATSDYNVTSVFTNRKIRTYFKDKQIHINSAVVYAFNEYFRRTQDLKFLIRSLPMLIECSNFYLDYALYSKKLNKYLINDVLGPDEYHERVNNNYYTNQMVKFTLTTTLHYINYLEIRDSESLSKILDINKIDINFLKEVAFNLYENKTIKTNVIEQFDGYFKLKDIKVKELLKQKLDPREYLGGSGLAGDTKVIKQADVVAYLSLFYENYDYDVLKQNFDYYFNKTEHGSSLSLSMYGILAARLNLTDIAYNNYLKSSYIDIDGKGKEYAGTIYIGGSHVASLGGAYLLLIKGFVGLSISNNTFNINPNFPKNIKSITFNLILFDKKYKIKCVPNGYEILSEVKI